MLLLSQCDQLFLEETFLPRLIYVCAYEGFKLCIFVSYHQQFIAFYTFLGNLKLFQKTFHNFVTPFTLHISYHSLFTLIVSIKATKKNKKLFLLFDSIKSTVWSSWTLKTKKLKKLCLNWPVFFERKTFSDCICQKFSKLIFFGCRIYCCRWDF